MKFGWVNPEAKDIKIIDAKTIQDALRIAGLDPFAVDHGTIHNSNYRVGIVVYEHGLDSDLEDGYWTTSFQLYNGNAILYGYDAQGETVDIIRESLPEIRHLGSPENVEKAIREGIVIRPISAMIVDGKKEVFWEWRAPVKDG